MVQARFPISVCAATVPWQPRHIRAPLPWARDRRRSSAIFTGSLCSRRAGRARRRHRQEISLIFLLAWQHTEALETELDRAGRTFVCTSDCLDVFSRLITSADFLLFFPGPGREC